MCALLFNVRFLFFGDVLTIFILFIMLISLVFHYVILYTLVYMKGQGIGHREMLHFNL